MEVINYSSKLVKPSTPTSNINRFYNISFTDELAPTINVPLVLYYAAPPYALNGHIGNIYDNLEDSLSKTLSEFYPLAGRYVRKLSLVDCNDQGVLYVLGKANVPLADFVGVGLKADFLNNFLPCEIGKADEVDDPMLSIKITTFACGGLAIGMCFSHRISDMGAMCTFINNWAARSSNNEFEFKKHSPIFNSTLYFPQQGLPELDLRVPRSSVGVENVAQRFLFKGDAISTMRNTLGFNGNGSHRASKVQLIVALLWKAFVRIDQANNSQSKSSFLIQAVGLRDNVVPKLPTNSCGNFWGLATSQLGPGEGDKIEFQDFFKILSDSVRKTVKNCGKILTNGEKGYEVVINPYLESNNNIADADVNFYLFTSWCKFSFYQADFGCGKPIWASTGKFPVQNLVIMMDDHDGDGVEAWVHLDSYRMKQLKQDCDINSMQFSLSSLSLLCGLLLNVINFVCLCTFK